MLIIVFFIHETLHVAERTKLFLCSLFFVLCPPPPYNTHAVPFTVAPTPLQIQAAIDHQEAKRREKENSMSTAFHMKASRLGGRREVEDDASSQSSYSNDGEESVSSVGSGSTGGASSGTERSRNRLVTQLRRAHHDTPFMAGGRVFYAPRRPHTRGSRNLTGMELEVMPLVTGARESVEHATSLESPRRAAHPSWTPHVELEPHPTFGKKYHGHHLHVHHHEGGHGGHKSGKDPGEDDDDPHAHKHHHHHHKHHHHHHHHGKGGHKRGRPKTLKECILSHETDVKVLSEAYRAANPCAGPHSHTSARHISNMSLEPEVRYLKLGAADNTSTHNPMAKGESYYVCWKGVPRNGPPLTRTCYIHINSHNAHANRHTSVSAGVHTYVHVARHSLDPTQAVAAASNTKIQVIQ